MPKRHGKEDRARRREAADARAATALAKLTPDEVRVRNMQLAREKAAHPEGGGHPHPELRPVELTSPVHHDQYRWVFGRREPIPNAEPCGIAFGLCLSCAAQDDTAITKGIHVAADRLREARATAARRARLPADRRSGLARQGI